MPCTLQDPPHRPGLAYVGNRLEASALHDLWQAVPSPLFANQRLRSGSAEAPLRARKIERRQGVGQDGLKAFAGGAVGCLLIFWLIVRKSISRRLQGVEWGAEGNLTAP
jgi:ferric-dicitrate binding protein FerR (iron transport regulator)